MLSTSIHSSKVPFFRVVHGYVLHNHFLVASLGSWFSHLGAFLHIYYRFLTQFGITPNRDLRKYWRAQGSILDDPSQGRQIKRGYLSYAGGGPNTRDSQLFIAYEGKT